MCDGLRRSRRKDCLVMSGWTAPPWFVPRSGLEVSNLACKGLSSVKGLRVTASGWVHIAGVHLVRDELARLLRNHGATFQQEFNSETQLVIIGEWRPHQLQDDRKGGVDAIDQVALSRRYRGPQVHLVAEGDLDALLRGELVPCRRVPRRWSEMQKKDRRLTERQRPYR